MANRYPLIYNSNANQLQELQSGDNLDLSSSGISSVGNINSTGVITATTFSGSFSGTSTLASGLTGSPSITVTGLFVSGVATFSQDIKLGDNDKANFGDGDDLRIYHDGSNSYVEDTGTGDLYISGSSNVIIQHHSTGETMAKFTGNGASELYYDNSKKFETVSAGATVTGNLNASGSVTATSFSGSGSGLTGVSTNFVAAIGIQSAGTVIGAGITQLNFIGAGNTFAVNGTTVNISIAGGGSASGGVADLDITSNLFF